jgi:hypothetical protein
LHACMCACECACTQTTQTTTATACESAVCARVLPAVDSWNHAVVCVCSCA